MGRIDTIVVGASAGGVEALIQLVGQLPEVLEASVFVVLHLPESGRSMLPQILSRSGNLVAKHAENGEHPANGTIYVAPPGVHMLLRNGEVRLVEGAKENGNRPAIDPLFRTAARENGPSVAGVILSGLLDDGTQGLAAVKRYGGITIAQSPNDAMYPDMPRNAIAHAGVDYALPIAELGQLLIRFTASGDRLPRPDIQLKDATEMSLQELSDLEGRAHPSTYTCPECHGTLFEVEEDGIRHYRCRVGHAYSMERLAYDQEANLETAMWTALRTLAENNSLIERMIRRSRDNGHTVITARLEEKLKEGMQRTKLIRTALTTMNAEHARRKEDE